MTETLRNDDFHKNITQKELFSHQICSDSLHEKPFLDHSHRTQHQKEMITFLQNARKLGNEIQLHETKRELKKKRSMWSESTVRARTTTPQQIWVRKTHRETLCSVLPVCRCSQEFEGVDPAILSESQKAKKYICCEKQNGSNFNTHRVAVATIVCTHNHRGEVNGSGVNLPTGHEAPKICCRI